MDHCDGQKDRWPAAIADVSRVACDRQEIPAMTNFMKQDLPDLPANLEGLPTIPMRVGDKLVHVAVCWDEERVRKTMSYFPNGEVPADPTLLIDPTATPTEKAWLVATARKLAGLPPLPTRDEMAAWQKNRGR
jgi:hypothetical protein